MKRPGIALLAAAVAALLGAHAAPADDVTRLAVGPDTTVTFSIHDSLPPFRFTLIHDAESGEVVRIDVRRGDDADPVQTLDGFPEVEPAPGGRDDVSVEDADFDGYGDLKLLAMWGATGNRAYHYWRYEPDSGRFAYDAALSALGNPTLDPAAQEIHTRAVGGMAGQVYTEGWYHWVDGTLTEIRRVRQDWDAERRAFTRVIEERRDGALAVVRHGLRFGGSVTDGERFTFDLTPRVYFELDPEPEGWEIAVRDVDRPGENLARLTPPLHGPNPRQIWDWQFRGTDAGSGGSPPGAPGREREFIFSEKVGRSIQGPSSDRGPTEQEVESVRADGSGRLTIDDVKLTPRDAAMAPHLQWMRFTVDVEFP